MKTLYKIIYRTGGTLSCEWRTLYGFYTLEQAQQECERLEKQGYKAISYASHLLAQIGLPIGWDAASIDYEQDTIEVNEHYTRWTSHTLQAAA